nr:hypothetical protein [Tanacetum cinerariifolium]
GGGGGGGSGVNIGNGIRNGGNGYDAGEIGDSGGVGNGIRNGGNGYDAGETEDSGGVGMASNLSTSNSEWNGIGICGRTDILAVTRTVIHKYKL